MAESFFPNDNPEPTATAHPEQVARLVQDEPLVKVGGFETGEFESDEGRAAAVLAYIPILCFVPLLNMRENKEARFHARQGVLLFLIELVALLFLVDGVAHFIFRVILIIAAVLSVAGILMALQGRSIRLPILSDLSEKVKL